MNAPSVLKVATRKSQLALWQAEHVAALVRATHPEIAVELLPMSTTGDRVLDRSLASIGGKGLFIKELESALSDLRADLAVHSMKDMPSELPAGLMIAAVLPRADPYDALVTAHASGFADLPKGARLGTSSLQASGAIAGGARRLAHRAVARERRHTAQAPRGRRARCHRVGLRRPDAPGARLAHRRAARSEGVVARGRSGRDRHRVPRRGFQHPPPRARARPRADARGHRGRAGIRARLVEAVNHRSPRSRALDARSA